MTNRGARTSIRIRNDRFIRCSCIQRSCGDNPGSKRPRKGLTPGQRALLSNAVGAFVFLIRKTGQTSGWRGQIQRTVGSRLSLARRGGDASGTPVTGIQPASDQLRVSALAAPGTARRGRTIRTCARPTSEDAEACPCATPRRRPGSCAVRRSAADRDAPLVFDPSALHVYKVVGPSVEY
jgi:hypothetical protein